MNSESRRLLYTHRKEGSGRTATVRPFDYTGSRTGWALTKDVQKDQYGMDNIDQFFDMGISTSNPPPSVSKSSSSSYVPSSTTKLYTPQITTTTSISSARKNKIVPDTIPEAIPETNFDDYPNNDDNYMDDNNNDIVPPPNKQRKLTNNNNNKNKNKKGNNSQRNSDYEDNDDDIVRTAPKPKKNNYRTTSSDNEYDNDNHRSKTTRTIPNKKLQPSSTRNRNTVEPDESSFYSPGGTDNRRKRYSLGTGTDTNLLGIDQDDDTTGNRRSNRRRWAPLQHWKNERIRYRENELLGVQEAVVAEKLGPLTPDVEAVGKRRSRSVDKDSRSRSRSRSVSRHSKDKHRHNNKHRSSSRDRNSDYESDNDSDNKYSNNHTSIRSSSNSVLASAMTGNKIDKTKLAKIPEVRSLLEEAVYNAGKGTLRQKAFNPANLPSTIHESTSSNIILDGIDGQPTYQMSVIRRSKTLTFEKLPDTSNNKNSPYPAQASAAAAFDAPEYISGSVSLKPKTIKALESTTDSIQIFTVLSAQPKSIEVNIGDRVYLVSPGDHFLVPRYCEYKLVNHSQDTPAEITFVVVRSPIGDSKK